MSLFYINWISVLHCCHRQCSNHANIRKTSSPKDHGTMTLTDSALTPHTLILRLWGTLVLPCYQLCRHMVRFGWHRPLYLRILEKTEKAEKFCCTKACIQHTFSRVRGTRYGPRGSHKETPMFRFRFKTSGEHHLGLGGQLPWLFPSHLWVG